MHVTVQWRQILVHKLDKTSVKSITFFHHDENRLVSGHISGRVIIWDVTDASIVRELPAHTGVMMTMMMVMMMKKMMAIIHIVIVIEVFRIG